jgi:uncharacterized protein
MTAQRGSEEPRRVRSAFVTVVDTSRWWTANFYIRHPFLSTYVNISTPPTWDGDRLCAVDLDLDVAQDLDGRVEVLDEDEFALHQYALSYPSDLIAQARQATDLAVQYVVDGVEPFGISAEMWLSKAEELEERIRRQPPGGSHHSRRRER